MKLTILNKSGIHARPATLFIQEARKYKSDIWVIKDDRKVNAKNILGVLSLGIVKGTEITLEAEGEDCIQALKALEILIKNKFDEE